MRSEWRNGGKIKCACSDYVTKSEILGILTSCSLLLNQGSKEEDTRMTLIGPSAKSATENGRPSSLVIKKTHRVIPAHIVAEAISTLHGLDLRWSGPITPTEMQYVEQYVLAKYPEYSNALVEGGEKTDLYDLCIKEKLSEPQPDDRKKSPRGVSRDSFTPSFGSSHPDLENTQLEPSRLLSILTKNPPLSVASSRFQKFKLETRCSNTVDYLMRSILFCSLKTTRMQ
ncbi:hypothetical protein Sango_1715200 [Sesamum angolense]|uniref:Uncharacterized protein n=1 Tax=Sesamum angolense TaxID=2727404 RepID=A0AAE1WLX6_9LAMI|nr:hypothetical protein Sango_1715200 [Sesamum angolense]